MIELNASEGTDVNETNNHNIVIFATVGIFK